MISSASAELAKPMYSEIKPNTAEKQELARRKLVQILKDNPKLSMNGCWAKAKADNPELFGYLEARDWEADDDAEEREAKENETHGSFKPATPGQHQFSLGEDMALRARLPKRVESTKEERILCVGGFFNPALTN
jgi:hypothetical protein